MKESTGWVKLIDSHDDYGMSPLHIAVRSGCISTGEMSTNRSGLTSLELACMGKSFVHLTNNPFSLWFTS